MFRYFMSSPQQSQYDIPFEIRKKIMSENEHILCLALADLKSFPVNRAEKSRYFEWRIDRRRGHLNWDAEMQFQVSQEGFEEGIDDFEAQLADLFPGAKTQYREVAEHPKFIKVFLETKRDEDAQITNKTSPDSPHCLPSHQFEASLKKPGAYYTTYPAMQKLVEQVVDIAHRVF